MNVKLDFISSGINARPNCLDICEKTNLVVYASANVIIIGTIDKKIPSYSSLMSLHYHESDIGCLKVVTKGDNTAIIISGDILGNVSVTHILIENDDYGNNNNYRVSLVNEFTQLKPYDMPINWIAAYPLNFDYNTDSKNKIEYLIAIGSCESYLQIYKLSFSRNSINMELYNILQFKNQIPLTGEFIAIDDNANQPVLLVGNDKGELLVCTLDSTNQNKILIKLKNHSDWVKVIRAIKIPSVFNDNEKSNRFYIATGGQDGLIVIYQLSDTSMNENTFVGSFVHNDSTTWYVYKESVLAGHGESRIADIQWTMYHYNKQNHSTESSNEINRNIGFNDCDNKFENDLCICPMELISTAEDRNIIKWSLDNIHTDENIWSDKVRFGMLNVQSNTGFLGCLVFKNSILTYGYDGAIYLWKPDCDEKCSYKLYYFISGHTRSVEAVNWQPEYGNFLITSSKDATCRVFCKHHFSKYGYCEMARPQMHGFGINCTGLLPNGYMASAAEEKMIRIFITPLTFYKTYSKYIGGKKFKTTIPYENIPMGAVLRPLGLSNKAVFEDDIMMENSSVQFNNNSLKEYGQMPVFQTIDLAIEERLLNEEKLQQSTLWPEHDKLYGHGNEVLVIEINTSLKLLASACIANNKETAEIILWNIDDWSIVQKIQHHKLTVTALQFSPDGQQLLSVSRDRSWALHQYNKGQFELLLDSTQTNLARPKHSRIIWDCSWSYDGQYFATGSRDNTVIVWNRTQSGIEAFSFKLPHAVTSLAFNNYSSKQFPPYLMVVGSEIGQLFLYNKTADFEWSLVYTVPKIYSPGKCINDICFKPSSPENMVDGNTTSFAVASADHSVRVYTIL